MLLQAHTRRKRTHEHNRRTITDVHFRAQRRDRRCSLPDLHYKQRGNSGRKQVWVCCSPGFLGRTKISNRARWTEKQREEVRETWKLLEEQKGEMTQRKSSSRGTSGEGGSDSESAVMKWSWRREVGNTKLFVLQQEWGRFSLIKSTIYVCHCRLPTAPGSLRCEISALQRQVNQGGNTWVSPRASHTWSNIGFSLLTPQRAAKEYKVSDGRETKEGKHIN